MPASTRQHRQNRHRLWQTLTETSGPIVMEGSVDGEPASITEEVALAYANLTLALSHYLVTGRSFEDLEPTVAELNTVLSHCEFVDSQTMMAVPAPLLHVAVPVSAPVALAPVLPVPVPPPVLRIEGPASAQVLSVAVTVPRPLLPLPRSPPVLPVVVPPPVLRIIGPVEAPLLSVAIDVPRPLLPLPRGPYATLPWIWPNGDPFDRTPRSAPIRRPPSSSPRRRGGKRKRTEALP